LSTNEKGRPPIPTPVHPGEWISFADSVSTANLWALGKSLSSADLQSVAASIPTTPAPTPPIGPANASAQAKPAK
jgi:hypothetical protein